MSDILAVLQGAGNLAKGVNLAASGGAQGEGAALGKDASFMAVLFSRLQGVGTEADIQGVAQQPDPALTLAAGELDPRQLPVQPAVLDLPKSEAKVQLAVQDLAQAVVQGQGHVAAQLPAQAEVRIQVQEAAQAEVSEDAQVRTPSRAADIDEVSVAGAPAQATPADASMQAILVSPAVAAAAASPAVASATQAAVPPTGRPAATDSLAVSERGSPAGRSGQRTATAALAAAGGRGAAAARSGADAAGDAGDRQLLPPSSGGGEAKPGQGRAEAPAWNALLQTSGQTQSMALQSQFMAGQVTEGGLGEIDALPPGAVQPGQAAPAQGLPVVSEAQARSSGGAVQVAVDAPLRSPQFAQELGERVVWLAGRHGQMADIALNPQHLGPVEVRLSMSGGEAGLQFFSPHQQVRDALEAALPRLREMLAETGVSLGQTEVREEAFTHRESLSGGSSPGNAVRDDESGQAFLAQSGAAGGRGHGLGLVDLYV